jgi:hypothetical protein
MNQDELIAGIGPLTSKWGFKTWRLLLGKDQLIACPYSTLESCRLGFANETGLVNEPEIIPLIWDEVQEMLRKSQCKTYNLSETVKLILRNRMIRNEIIICRFDGIEDSYGIFKRQNTDLYRSILRSLYPRQYQEAGFPKTLLGRILKS